MNSRVTKCEILRQKCSKYESELEYLEIMIGAKYADLMLTMKEESCVQHILVDLSHQIKKLRKEADMYKKHIHICKQKMKYIEAEAEETDESDMDVDDVEDIVIEC